MFTTNHFSKYCQTFLSLNLFFLSFLHISYFVRSFLLSVFMFKANWDKCERLSCMFTHVNQLLIAWQEKTHMSKNSLLLVKYLTWQWEHQQRPRQNLPRLLPSPIILSKFLCLSQWISPRIWDPFHIKMPIENHILSTCKSAKKLQKLVSEHSFVSVPSYLA